MGYRFHADESVLLNLRRIARQEIEAALNDLADAQLDQDVLIHEVRKRTKRVRALLRLVRSGMQELAQTENAKFRDAAAGLSSARDADVAVATLATLERPLGKRLSRESCARLQSALDALRDRPAAEQGGDLNKSLAEFGSAMQAALERTDDWEFSSDDMARLTGSGEEDPASSDSAREVAANGALVAIAGAVKVYHQARKRMQEAAEIRAAEHGERSDDETHATAGEGSADRQKALPVIENADDVPTGDPLATAFHDWRKRVKAHGYHLRLLRDLAPRRMRARGRQASRLGDLLGNDHDLAMLGQLIAELPPEALSRKELARVQRVLARRSLRLRDRAMELGDKLFRRSSKDFQKFLERKWRRWRDK